MRVNEFIDLSYVDINNMDEDELRSVVTQMSKVANRRLKNLSKLNIPSQAFANRAVYEDGEISRDDYGNFKYDEFGAGDKNINGLRREAKFLRSFLESETSTVTGAKSAAIDMIMRVGGYKTKAEARRNMWSYDESKEFWTLYYRLLETDYNMIKNIIGSKETQRIVERIRKSSANLSIDELWQNARQILKDIRNEKLARDNIFTD